MPTTTNSSHSDGKRRSYSSVCTSNLHHRPYRNTTAAWAIAITLIGIAMPGANQPSYSHSVKISSQVGGTMHIEPNDVPRANVPSTVWFALTQRGGAVIPNSACDCQLEIHASRQSPDTLVATPVLAAIDAEGYQQIPSATVTFPTVGSYELVLRGQPTEASDFDSFELRFNVTVAR